MSHQVYLIINSITLPLPTSYVLEYRDIEAETGGETEAGTIQRDIVRHGVVSIGVTFNCSPQWVKTFSGLKQNSMLQVRYLDTESLELKTSNMYIEGFSVKLIKDTSYKGLWEVSFTLSEY
ncbi:hypothetical protein [Falseniella ignava]|uniref:Uncharacterized protein n=1 Tax=Falseniella ignava CCUG 37419 TaxID=883112 RepID=K1LN74_9LACT|nr:hypothetical protein [Falseniella ignava]EKB53577.1 hypothetical protein HMPREF9707_01602 [Falseniella ignava CCUG 37419]